jgi:hypothetical protein
MEQVLQLGVVFYAALATGGLMVNWIGLGRAMSRLSVSTYIEFHQATNRKFDPYMPIVVVGALLGGIVLAPGEVKRNITAARPLREDRPNTGLFRSTVAGCDHPRSC